MAYSRWSNSTWYTYWCANSDYHYKFPTKKLKDSQVFMICDIPSYSFTYKELQEFGIYVLLKKIKRFYSVKHEVELLKDLRDLSKPVYESTLVDGKNPTEEEMIELIGYIRQWEKDVDDHFKLCNFFKYEWWYPIRNKLKIKKWKKF